MNRVVSADEYVVVAKIRLRRAGLVTLPFTIGDESIVGTKCERAGAARRPIPQNNPEAPRFP